MPFFRTIVDACWVVFVIVWIVSARGMKATVERDSRFLRFVVVAAIVAGIMIMNFARPIRIPALVPTGVVAGAVGAFLCIAGLAIAIWARRTIGRNWSGTVTFKQDHELIQRGPYAFVRHPIYSGLLLMAVGTILTFSMQSGPIALIVLFLALWIKFHREEIMMTKHFPDAYPAYKARVKAIIPHVL